MKVSKGLVVLIMSLSMISCNSEFKRSSSLETQLDTVSYAMGLNMAAQINQNFKEINKDLYVQAILDAMDSADLIIELKEAQPTVQAYFTKKREKILKEQQANQMKDALEKFGDNKKAGEDFLAANKSKKGVITTASGLQYKVIKEGKGPKPAPTAKVKLHYHGTNIEGQVFDSSVERKTPYELGVHQFVKGFGEGLQLMNVGSKYMFYIPQELAYGAVNKGPMIKPFSTLIFEVELLEILDK